MFPSRMKLTFLIGKVLCNQRNKIEMRRLNTNSWSLHAPQDLLLASAASNAFLGPWSAPLFPWGAICLPAYSSSPYFELLSSSSCWKWSGPPASCVSGNFKASHIQKQGDAWDRLFAPSTGGRQRKVDQCSRYCSNSLTSWWLLLCCPISSK